MPYQKNGKWKAQVRMNEKRKERTFKTKKEAIAWESKMRNFSRSVGRSDRYNLLD